MATSVRARRLILTLIFEWTLAAIAAGQSCPVRVIAFGAHPDDTDFNASGTAAIWARMGCAVKFVSVTNGDAGHQAMKGEALAKRRLAEAQESARRLGISVTVLNNHDGKLLPTLEVRDEIIREIRKWRADVVLGPRPNDYHPDHRYTGVLVEDAAYMVVVPDDLPDTPALKKNPAFFYYEDRFQRPNPFRGDVVVSIDDVVDKKVEALDSHVSQVYEWLPWVGGFLDQVPSDHNERKVWLKKQWIRSNPKPEFRTSLEKWYGAPKAQSTVYYEAFELCEYGTQPDEHRMRELFPMLH